jgi:hypothetical protein
LSSISRRVGGAVRGASRLGSGQAADPGNCWCQPAIEPALVDRRANINIRRGELAIQFQQDHGRPPTPVEVLQLAQQATLETRDAKHEPQSFAEQRATWLNEAAAVLGGGEAVASMVRTALAPPAETATVVDSRWVAQTADRLLAAMEETRSTWQMWHVRAEAQRHVRAVDMPVEQANTLVDLLVDEVLEHRSVALAAPPDGIKNRARCGGSMGRRFTPSTRGS